MEITKCLYGENCIWVTNTRLPTTFKKTNTYYNANSLQHICEGLHPRESVKDFLVRVGVKIPVDTE